MRHDYDIFEKFADGSSVWRGWACGKHATRRKIQDLAENSTNDFFAIDIQAGELAAVRTARSVPRTASREQAQHSGA